MALLSFQVLFAYTFKGRDVYDEGERVRVSVIHGIEVRTFSLHNAEGTH
jgi:hypothetical protein